MSFKPQTEAVITSIEMAIPMTAEALEAEFRSIQQRLQAIGGYYVLAHVSHPTDVDPNGPPVEFSVFNMDPVQLISTVLGMATTYNDVFAKNKGTKQ